MDSGVDAERFWGMSMAEVLAAVASYGRREKLRGSELVGEIKQLAGLLYRHAQLAAVAAWDGKKYPKSLEAAFPGLFNDTVKEDSSEAVPLWKKQQAAMAAWVEAYNYRIRRQEGVKNNGGTADAGDSG